MARNRFLVWTLLAGLPGVLAFSCSQTFTSDSLQPMDKNLEAPFPQALEAWEKAYESGQDRWRGDPKQVADVALRESLELELIPWFPDPYRPKAYELKYREDWGTYVVRYYTFPSGGVMHYRVKIRQFQDVWYPVQVSHYKEHALPHPALED